MPRSGSGVGSGTTAAGFTTKTYDRTPAFLLKIAALPASRRYTAMPTARFGGVVSSASSG